MWNVFNCRRSEIARPTPTNSVRIARTNGRSPILVFHMCGTRLAALLYEAWWHQPWARRRLSRRYCLDSCCMQPHGPERGCGPRQTVFKTQPPRHLAHVKAAEAFAQRGLARSSSCGLCGGISGRFRELSQGLWSSPAHSIGLTTPCFGHYAWRRCSLIDPCKGVDMLAMRTVLIAKAAQTNQASCHAVCFSSVATCDCWFGVSAIAGAELFGPRRTPAWFLKPLHDEVSPA